VTHVLFLLAPQVHILDLAGPAQVFGEAADFGYPYEVSYVADREEVLTAQGLAVHAATEWPPLNPDDIVIVPGWKGDGPFTPASLAKLVEHHAEGGTVASVCSGTDALGRAGLLDGRRCTTHHQLQDDLAREYPRAKVVKDVLYTVDGRVVTSAGIASGIDLALHLVAIEHGPAAAARVAREMVVYARRNGDEPQASVMLRHRSHLSDVVHRVQDLIDCRFTDRLLLADLAAASQVSERTLTRLFTASTGVTPLRYQQLLRVERAEHLIGHGSTVESAAHAVGFEDARMLRRLRARV
jgi:transcriptional regulator GlxA family with amidase domain